MKRSRILSEQMEGLQQPTHHMIHILKVEKRSHSSTNRQWRFLGQEIFKDLSDKEIRSGVDSKMKELLVRVDEDNVNSIAKMWMYENHIVNRISWEFIILLPHLICS